MKKAIDSRVLWFNGLCAGLLALQASLDLFKPIVGDKFYMIMAAVLPVFNAALRYFTTEQIQPIKIKKNKKKKATATDVKQES